MTKKIYEYHEADVFEYLNVKNMNYYKIKKIIGSYKGVYYIKVIYESAHRLTHLTCNYNKHSVNVSKYIIFSYGFRIARFVTIIIHSNVQLTLHLPKYIWNTILHNNLILKCENMSSILQCLTDCIDVKCIFWNLWIH